MELKYELIVCISGAIVRQFRVSIYDKLLERDDTITCKENIRLSSM